MKKPVLDKSLGATTNTKSMYQTYSTYLDYNTGGNFISGGVGIYMDYRIRGGKWKTSGKMSSYYQTYKISKLKPNRYYYARTYRGYWRDGTFYRGPYSKTVAIKTGQAKKPAIKSIKVKAVKVKKHRGTAYWGWLPIGKYKYYSYKIKVTVKLKKKPPKGDGVNINGKRFKGNRKKYTFTLGPYTNYSKPKGKKFKVSLYYYHSAKYGGYSPMYSKTVKVK